MAASEKIWVSEYRADSRLIRSISFPGTNDASVAMSRATESGTAFDQIWVPPYVYWDLQGISERKRASLPSIFMISGGLVCVQDRLRTFLADFDLGNSQFYPVSLFELDQETPRPDKIQIFNLVGARETVIIEQTDNIRYKFGSTPSIILGTERITVERSCLKGPDIWVDPRFHSMTFFSDRLVRAVKGKGFGTFAFRECILG